MNTSFFLMRDEDTPKGGESAMGSAAFTNSL